METKQRVDDACDISIEFIKAYYETIDKRRHLMKTFYDENAVFIWNGHGIHSPDKIQNFFNDLPVSHHVVHSVDSQPLPLLPGLNASFVIEVCGSVNYESHDPKSFIQSFIVLSHDTKWKVSSDIFRLLEPNPINI